MTTSHAGGGCRGNGAGRAIRPGKPRRLATARNSPGEVGVIAPGKLADIVIWDKDPIADITVLQRQAEASLIIKDGQIVDTEGGDFRQLSEEPPRARMFFAG